jgi:hypothetical protein
MADHAATRSSRKPDDCRDMLTSGGTGQYQLRLSTRAGSVGVAVWVARWLNTRCHSQAIGVRFRADCREHLTPLPRGLRSVSTRAAGSNWEQTAGRDW